jgi:hypothetical protein
MRRDRKRETGKFGDERRPTGKEASFIKKRLLGRCRGEQNRVYV